MTAVYTPPICSYGIIMFTYSRSEGSLRDPEKAEDSLGEPKKDEVEIKYLLCQRRDTIEYTDFLRGRYTLSNLKTYISLLTEDERNRILNYSFSDLWYDLWVNHHTKLYKEIYPKAKTRFDTNFELVKNMISDSRAIVKEPVWGFPKGKQNSRESDINTAIREFKEESKLPIGYKNIVNIPPAIETFKGSNGKMYSTFYYIAHTSHKHHFKRVVLDGIRKDTISEEISNLCWVTLEEAKRLLPPWRRKLLVETENRIRKYLSLNP